MKTSVSSAVCKADDGKTKNRGSERRWNADGSFSFVSVFHAPLCACIFFMYSSTVFLKPRELVYIIFFHASQSRKEMKKWQLRNTKTKRHFLIRFLEVHNFFFQMREERSILDSVRCDGIFHRWMVLLLLFASRLIRKFLVFIVSINSIQHHNKADNIWEWHENFVRSWQNHLMFCSLTLSPLLS